jgi:hypothetical protein
VDPVGLELVHLGAHLGACCKTYFKGLILEIVEGSVENYGFLFKGRKSISFGSKVFL